MRSSASRHDQPRARLRVFRATDTGTAIRVAILGQELRGLAHRHGRFDRNAEGANKKTGRLAPSGRSRAAGGRGVSAARTFLDTSVEVPSLIPLGISVPSWRALRRRRWPP